jgi:hypothetical protein
MLLLLDRWSRRHIQPERLSKRKAARRAAKRPAATPLDWTAAVAAVRDLNADEHGEPAILAIASIPYIVWFYPGLLVGWLVDSALTPVLGEQVAQTVGGTVWFVAITGASWFLARAALAWLGARWRVSWIDDAVILAAALALAVRR